LPARFVGAAGEPVADRRGEQIRIGTVIGVEEPDYRYGTGRLLLRLTSLGPRHREHDGLWLELRGHEVDPTGREDPRERHAVVRLRGITIISPGDES
jgi:hypothetical protein